MTIRFRAVSAASMALVVGLGMATAGCGKYSIGTLKAIKAFKDGNLAYAQKDWKKAIEYYEEVTRHPDAFGNYPQLSTAYFFLGNSYDQLYKPAKQGDATNDAYIQKAIENYRKAADTNTDPAWKKSSLEYLAAAYGSDKLNDPAQGGAGLPGDHLARSQGTDQLPRARQALRGHGPVRRGRGRVRQSPRGETRRPVGPRRRGHATTTARATSKRRLPRSKRPPPSSPTTRKATTASPRSTGRRPTRTTG